MPDEFAQTPFGAAEFADNPEPRCPCLLLLDNSGSMSGNPIAELNRGLKTFHEELLGRQPGGQARGSGHRHVWTGEGRTGVHGRCELLSAGTAIERQHADGRSHRTRSGDAAAAQGAVSDRRR